MRSAIILLLVGSCACGAKCTPDFPLPGDTPVVVASADDYVQWWEVHTEHGRILFDWSRRQGGSYSYFTNPLRSGGIRDGVTPRFTLVTDWPTDGYVVPLAEGSQESVARLLTGLNPGRWPIRYSLLTQTGDLSEMFSCDVGGYPQTGGAESPDEVWVGVSTDCSTRCPGNWSTALFGFVSGKVVQTPLCIPPDPAQAVSVAIHPTKRIAAIGAGTTIRIIRFHPDLTWQELARGELKDMTWMRFDPTAERLIYMNFVAGGPGESTTTLWELTWAGGTLVSSVSPLNEKFATIDLIQPVRSGYLAEGSSRAGDNRVSRIAAYVEAGQLQSVQLVPRLGFRLQVAEEAPDIYGFQESYPRQDGGSGFQVLGMRLDL